MTYMCNACRKPVVPEEHVSVGGLIHHAECAAALTPKRSQCEAKIYNGIADMNPRPCVLVAGHIGEHQTVGGAALALFDLVSAGMRGAARGEPTVAARVERAADLLRDVPSLTREQYLRVLETGDLHARVAGVHHEVGSKCTLEHCPHPHRPAAPEMPETLEGNVSAGHITVMRGTLENDHAIVRVGARARDVS